MLKSGATTEDTQRKFCYTFRNIDAGQTAILKGIITKLLKGSRQFDILKAGAHKESTYAYCLEISGHVHLAQCFTHLKTLIGNLFDII